MKAIIVAAGMGRRLAPYTDDRPKTLVEVNGRSILQRQVDAYRAAGVDEINIVRGYMKEKIVVEGARYFDNDDFRNNNILVVAVLRRAGDGRRLPLLLLATSCSAPRWCATVIDTEGDYALVIDRRWHEAYVGRVNHPVEEGEVARVDDGRVTLVGKKTMPPERGDRRVHRAGALLRARASSRCASAFTSGEAALAGQPYGRAPRFEVAYLTDLLNDLIDSGRGHAAGVHRRRLARDRHRRGSRARQGRGELVKILIIDAFSEAHLDALRALGLTVEYKPQLTADELPAAIDDASIVVARSKEVKAAAIARARRWRSSCAPAPASTPSTSRRPRRNGIYVANCPGKNAIAVAELTMALLLALDRRIPDQVRDLRAGAWNKKEYGKADGLYGRTLGVVGTGSIGQEVIRRARAFGMHVVAWSRSLDDARAAELGVERMRTVPELCGRADAVTLHVALAPETRGLIGEAALRRMRPRTMLVNAARAEIVDAAALEARHRREAAARRPRRVRRRAQGRHRRLRRRARAERRASTARTTWAPRPSRRRAPSPTRRCASCAPSSSAARCPTA